MNLLKNKYLKYSFILLIIALGLGSILKYLYHYDKKSIPFKKQQFIDRTWNISFWKNITPEELEKQLKNIKDINQITKYKNRNRLHLAILYGQYPEFISILIKAGIDYSLRDNTRKVSETIKGTKALHYAVMRENPEWTKELLKYDKDIDAKSLGATPLHWALFNRKPIKTIQHLLKNGANPHIITEKGKNTTLINASIPNHFKKIYFIDPEVIQLLLDYKVDLKIKGGEGKTAYDYMKENEDFIKTPLFQKISNEFKEDKLSK